ncbi:uncharacterized protein LOC116024096 [Ipomoea triloba]|uniref:uncharacterized protein LOC116024096 n=1 Tax=Ipomoea triloba TaxID=35885 RepID=UPI00125E7A39|nr:uncharacterized protein LOC116024096 [Ipomoea triloba]
MKRSVCSLLEQSRQSRNNQNNHNPNQGQFQEGNQNFGNTQGQGFSRPSQHLDIQTLMNTMIAQMSKLLATVESQQAALSTQQNALISQQAALSSQQALIESLTWQNQGGCNQFSNQASSSNGRLPASTENPRHQVNAVTTMSGLALKDHPLPSNDPVPERTDKKDEGIQVEDGFDESGEEPVIQRDSAKGKAPVPDESTPSKKHERKNKKVDNSVIPCNLLPYPQRLWKSKESDRESEFHKMLDKLEISMPFVEAITQIPSYKKFLKNILGNKKKAGKSAVVDLSEGALTCAVHQHKLPPKLKDPGSFAIPCIIGGFVVRGALFDLGASVSLMPYSLCKRLNLGTPKPTSMILQMADCSIKRPVGVLEDVPVMIDQYFILGDFVVLDIEEDAKVPIILGRPFLATAGALIDVRRGKLVMEVAENKIEFDIFKMAKHQPSYVDECYLIEGLDERIDESTKSELGDLHVLPIDPEPPEKSSLLKRKEKFFGSDGFYKRWMRELAKFRKPPDRVAPNLT